MAESDGTDGGLHLFIDTTELWDDLRARGKDWDRLLHASRVGAVKVYVAEVVIAEASRHFRRQANRARKEAEGPLADLRRLHIDVGALPPQELRKTVNVQKDEYEGDLRKRLLGAGVTLLPLPNVSHEVLLAALMAGRKPFKEDGDGYRDALVWATAVELMVSLPLGDVLLLVTNNSKDFVRPDKSDLADDLTAEIRGHEPHAAVEWRRDLAAVMGDVESSLAALMADVAAVAPPFDEAQRPTLDELVQGAVLGELDNLLGLEVRTYTHDGGIDEMLEVDLPSDMDPVSIYNIDPEVDTLTTQLVQTYEDDETVLVLAELEAQVTLDGFMSKADYYGAEHEVEALDSDWNEHSAWVQVHRRLRLAFSLRVNVGGEYAEVLQFDGASQVSNFGP